MSPFNTFRAELLRRFPRIFVVFFESRSGANLLCDDLRNNGLGNPYEALTELNSTGSDDDTREYLIRQLETCRVGDITGVKIPLDTYRRLLAAIRRWHPDNEA